MNTDVIGTNAGSVWNVLNGKNAQPLKALKKATKLKDKEIYPALGWLAREGKIAIEESEDDVIITLV